MSLEMVGLTKRFGEVTAARRGRPQGGRGRAAGRRRTVGMRQDDADPGDRRARDPRRRPRDHPGQRCDLHAPEKRNVSLVFQNFAFFPHMNVAENVAYGLRWTRLSRARKERSGSREAGDGRTVGAAPPPAPRAERGPATADGARPGPRPPSGDPAARRAPLRARRRPAGSLRLEIRRIQKELGITTILVTHDQEEALGIADRVAVMNQAHSSRWARRGRSTTHRPRLSSPVSSARET